MGGSNPFLEKTDMKTRSQGKGNADVGTGTLPAQNNTEATESKSTVSTATATADNNNNNSKSKSNSNTTAHDSASKEDNNSDRNVNATIARSAATGSNTDNTGANNDKNAELPARKSAGKPSDNANNANAAGTPINNDLSATDSAKKSATDSKKSATDGAEKPPVNVNNANANGTAISKKPTSSPNKKKRGNKQSGKPPGSGLSKSRATIYTKQGELDALNYTIKARGGNATKQEKARLQKLQSELKEEGKKVTQIISDAMDDDVEMSGTSLERKARTQWDARVILCLSNIEEDGTLTVGAGVNATTPCVKLTHALMKTIVLGQNNGVVNDTVMMATFGLKVPEGEGNEKVEDHVSTYNIHMSAIELNRLFTH